MRKLMPLVMAITLLFAIAPYIPDSFAQDGKGILLPGDGAAPTPSPTPDPSNPTAQSTPTETETAAIEVALSIVQSLLAVF